MSDLAQRIVRDALADGFCRWCRVLVGSEGHKATSECPVAMAEEELREAPAFLPTSDLDDIMALVDSVPSNEPASVTMELDDVRALVAECLAGRANGAAASTPAPAWEWSKDGTAADLVLGRFTVGIYQSTKGGQWYGDWTAFAVRPDSVGPYPTAPEAARAAVEALRAIVEPVVEGLGRVPELEMKP